MTSSSLLVVTSVASRRTIPQAGSITNCTSSLSVRRLSVLCLPLTHECESSRKSKIVTRGSVGLLHANRSKVKAHSHHVPVSLRVSIKTHSTAWLAFSLSCFLPHPHSPSPPSCYLYFLPFPRACMEPLLPAVLPLSLHTLSINHFTPSVVPFPSCFLVPFSLPPHLPIRLIH